MGHRRLAVGAHWPPGGISCVECLPPGGQWASQQLVDWSFWSFCSFGCNSSLGFYIYRYYIASWNIECFNVLDLSFLISLRNKQKGMYIHTRTRTHTHIYIAVSVNMVLLLTNYPNCLVYIKSDINILYTKRETTNETSYKILDTIGI